jgi:benzoyl-CoA reductase/2-hydroxyglutaryl-CoA dehydratase subunit BcrC/BadD/HgdB
MPTPDFLIGSSAPCSGGLAVIENLARYHKKDLFVIHLPFDRNEENVRYLADELRRMVEFVSRRTGEQIDPSRLRCAMELTNQARAIMDEVYALAKQIPSPLRSRDLKDFGIVISLFLGTTAAVDIAQAFKDELILRSQAAPETNSREKIRLLWIQNRIQFKNPLMELLENEYGATIVVDEWNDINWEPIDPEDPFPGLARRLLAMPLHGALESRISHLQKLARDYKVDGAINPCHWGCRQGTGGRGMIQRGLQEIGLPVLNLEVDCMDERNFAEGQMRTRLEAFLEMLGG